ncbi:MAG: hypothetical protein JW804_06685 [Sedimentisphaerales bacterium]|nr:hypothetical protein [Sedimentisphaerales bacterium]
MRAITILLICGLFMFSGCLEDNFYKKLEGEKFQLEKENQQLEKQLEQEQSTNRQLTKQVETLSSLEPEKRINGLYELESVRITKYTNFYDKDKNGTKEKLIVYIQPIDSEGDIIKAAGTVDVELWDLDRSSDNAKLAGWKVEPQELKEMWFGTVVTSNYRLMFDIEGIVESFDKPLTVKVVFTDYVSGKVFNEQYLIKP